MWLIGLILGAIIGAIGGAEGAIVGALAGAAIGVALRGGADSQVEARFNAIEGTVHQLTERIKALEQRSAQEAVKVGGGDAAPVENNTPLSSRQPESHIAADIATATASEGMQGKGADILSPAPATALADSTTPGALGESAEALTRPPAWGGLAQVIGAVGGAFMGSALGVGGILIGAIAGWGIAIVIVLNRRVGVDAPTSGTLAGDGEAVSAEPAPANPGKVEFEVLPRPTSTDQTPIAAEPLEVSSMAPSGNVTGKVHEWFRRLVGGNIVAKVGVVILFFGVGFLLKYAYDRGALPLQLRLAGVAVFGFGMLFAGWRLRDVRRLYGLILQGGGIGLLYLDVFFALRVYGFLDLTVGFIAFMALGVAATLLAVRQDAKVLAVLGLTGAFLAPLLAGSQTGNHVLLFSYYTLLNGFILCISWFKAWRELNLVGFIFTFVIGLLWGVNNYRPELFSSVEPFVLVFFVMYLVIPVLFARRQPPELKGLVDGTLVFGTPLAASFMQASLVRDTPYALAWSAGCVAFLYGLLAATTIRRDGMRLLGETYVALSVVFLTLAIFFALDAYPTFALWTLEGAAIIWVGLRQRRILAQLFGLALQLAGAFYFMIEYRSYGFANPWFNDFVIGCLLISAAGFLISWLFHRHRGEVTRGFNFLAGVMIVWAALWWFVAGIHALYHAYPWSGFVIGLLGFAAFSFTMAELAGTRFAWDGLRRLSVAHLPALLVVASMLLLSDQDSQAKEFARPLAHGGYWAWPLNFMTLFWIYHRQIHSGLVSTNSLRYVITWVLAAALATWDVIWLLVHGDYIGVLAWGAVGMAAAAARFWWRERFIVDAMNCSAWILWWGAIWWFIGGIGLVERHADFKYLPAAYLGFFTVTFLGAEWLGRWITWKALRSFTVIHIATMMGIMLLTYQSGAQPLGGSALVAWAGSFAVLYWTLRRQFLDGIALAFATRFWAGGLLMAFMVTREVIWQLDHQRHLLALIWSALGMLAGYVRFRVCERGRENVTPVSNMVLAWGMAFWLISGFQWIDSSFVAPFATPAMLGYIVILCLFSEMAGTLGVWPDLRRTALLLPAAMIIALVIQISESTHPFAAYGWLSWSMGFVVLYVSLRRQEREKIVLAGGVQHVLTLWLATLVLAWETAWQFSAYGFSDAWVRAGWCVVVTFMLGGISAFKGRQSWPFGQHYEALYRSAALGPIAVLAVLTGLYANLVPPGSMAPLPYIPLLNPIDLAQIAVLLAVWRWWGTFSGTSWSRGKAAPFMAGLAFLWINCVVLRTIHFWADVDYRLDVLINSMLVQSAFSLLWIITALVLMLSAKRNKQRKLWIAGAALLAVVVGKLFLLDLANSGTVERIISFIGVGAGLLAIGYFAPVPPGDIEQEAG